MKNKKKMFIIIGIVLFLVVALILFLIIKNTNTNSNNLSYLTINDITNIKCYDLLNKEVSCDSNSVVYQNYVEKENVKKVLVDLNGEEKGIFIVLKGDIEKYEDLILIYEGLYKYNNKTKFTYDVGQNILNSLNWSNAKNVRLLTNEEALLLGCDDLGSSRCEWLFDEDNSEKSSSLLIGDVDYFMVSRSLVNDNLYQYFYVSTSGILEADGYKSINEVNDEEYGLRPVIEINSKYVENYSDIKYIYLENDNQKITAKFVNDKLIKLEITKEITNLSNTEYEELDKKIDEIESDNVVISSASFDNEGIWNLTEYISIYCKNITLDELNQYFKLSSLEITSTEFINELKNNGYVENN